MTIKLGANRHFGSQYVFNNWLLFIRTLKIRWSYEILGRNKGQTW